MRYGMGNGKKDPFQGTSPEGTPHARLIRSCEIQMKLEKFEMLGSAVFLATLTTPHHFRKIMNRAKTHMTILVES